MVSISPTPDLLWADARSALRKRLLEPGRTNLNRAFAAWLLDERGLKTELVALATEAGTRKGNQQDFHTIAILGFAAQAQILDQAQMEGLRLGLLRQAGREPIIDRVPMGFCSDAVGILGLALGTKSIADAELTMTVVRWISRFLKSSYEMEGVEEWRRCLFAAGDRQLGSPLHLSFPNSAATADVRTVLIGKGLVETDDEQTYEDCSQTLRLALREPHNELSWDRAALLLAGLESVLDSDLALNPRKGFRGSKKQTNALSARAFQVYEIVGTERFCTLTNAEIMRDPNAKRRLRNELGLSQGDAAKRLLDRIRLSKGYLLSRDIIRKRSAQTAEKRSIPK